MTRKHKKKGRIFTNEKKENQILLINKIVENSEYQDIYIDWASDKKQERSSKGKRVVGKRRKNWILLLKLKVESQVRVILNYPVAGFLL